MTVQKIYVNGESILEDQLDLNIESHRHLLYDMVLNNDSSIVDGKGIGDPTEYALLETFQHIGLDENVLRDVLTRVEEVPFDSDRKMMSTKYKMHGVNHILTKGALDSILDRCVSIATKTVFVRLQMKIRLRFQELTVNIPNRDSVFSPLHIRNLMRLSRLTQRMIIHSSDLFQ